MTPSDAARAGLSPCWYCRYWDGPSGPHALCALPGASRVKATPRDGCAFYERLAGIDDDFWEPGGRPITSTRSAQARIDRFGSETLTR